MDKTISNLLQEIKAETGWGEIRLAKELGTSQPTVNRILHGQADCMGSTFSAINRLHARVCIQAVARINKKQRKSLRTAK